MPTPVLLLTLTAALTLPLFAGGDALRLALAAARADTSFWPYCAEELDDPESVVCRATSGRTSADAAVARIARELSVCGSGAAR